jgi:putative N6-adenine-specific DNA methylase
MKLIASAAAGLEAIVARELRELGYANTRNLVGGVEVDGAEAADIARLNLWLRTSDRVKLVVGRFEARSFESLFDQTFALDWSELLPPDARFPVSGRSYKSQLGSVPDCQAIVKKAIVESLKRRHGGIDWFGETGASFAIEVALREDEATLSIDCSGEGLHKRGYRRHAGEAPLRETLAAALVQFSFWNADRPLVDLFCGSGTIPIEAAMIGRRIAPGLGRAFASMDWSWIGTKAWDAARDEAMDEANWDGPLDIQGSDLDPSMVEIATANAQAAGLDESIVFKQMRATDFGAGVDHGVIISNPPYGERSGDAKAAAALYRELGKMMAKSPTWSHYWLSGHPAFEAAFGKKADRRRKLYNAGISCQYFQYYGPPPPRT